MGRTVKPVEGVDDGLIALAQDLRRLRREAGSPPYRTMAAQARYSASTLSEAASGRRLPTLPVLLAYVAVCGGRPQDWEVRWHAVSASLQAPQDDAVTVLASPPTTQPSSSPAAPDDAPPPAAPHGPPAGPDLAAGQTPASRWRRRRLLMAAGCTAAVAAAAVAGALTLGPHHLDVTRSRALTASRTAVPDDSDPKDAGCDQGQVTTVARADLFGPDRLYLGAAWLRYSALCNVVWARFEPSGTMARLPGAHVEIWAQRPADHRVLRYRTPYLGDFVYGNTLGTSTGCVSAGASVTAPRPTRGPLTALAGTGPIRAQATTACVTSGRPATS